MSDDHIPEQSPEPTPKQKPDTGHAKAKNDGADPPDNGNGSKWGNVSADPNGGWGPISIGGGAAELPPPGVYPGVLEIKLIDKGDVLWLRVDYQLDGLSARPQGDMGAIAAMPGSEHAGNTAKGQRLLYRLSLAAGIDPKTSFNVDDITSTFDGRPVKLRVRHSVREGVPELVVSEIRKA